MKELLALNHGIDPTKVEEKQTILLPAGRLSSRDKEILSGAPQPPRPQAPPSLDAALASRNTTCVGPAGLICQAQGMACPGTKPTVQQACFVMLFNSVVSTHRIPLNQGGNSA